jgi:hypothetical protein
VELLSGAGAFVHAQHETPKGPWLHEAIVNGDTAIVESLLQRVVDREFKDCYGQTALLDASRMGFEFIAKLLIESQADYKTEDNYGRRPLWWAVKEGHDAIVQLLLERRVDIGAPDRIDSRSALSWAAEGGFIPVIKLLLNKDADAQCRNVFDRTPLFFAADAGHAEVVQLLLDRDIVKDVVPDSRDTLNQTPLCRAQLKRRENSQSYEHNISISSPERPRLQFNAPADGGQTADSTLLSGEALGAMSLYKTKIAELLSKAFWPKEAFVRFIFDHDVNTSYLSKRHESSAAVLDPTGTEHQQPFGKSSLIV